MIYTKLQCKRKITSTTAQLIMRGTKMKISILIVSLLTSINIFANSNGSIESNHWNLQKY